MRNQWSQHTVSDCDARTHTVMYHFPYVFISVEYSPFWLFISKNSLKISTKSSTDLLFLPLRKPNTIDRGLIVHFMARCQQAACFLAAQHGQQPLHDTASSSMTTCQRQCLPMSLRLIHSWHRHVIWYCVKIWRPPLCAPFYMLTT